MNQVKNSISTDSISAVVVNPAPLFASSWVALYCYFRNFLDKDRTPGDTRADTPGAEAEHTRH